MNESIVNRIADLPRPAPQYPRHFAPIDIDLGNWASLELLYHSLLDRQIKSVEELVQWLKDNSEMSAVVGEEASRRYITMTCATDNQAAESAYLFYIEEIMPKLKPLGFRLDKKFLECPYTADLDPDFYRVLLRSTRNAVELFREENVPLETELDKLSQQYQKIQGAMTVMFQGQERTMQQMGVFAQYKDRALRQEAWETVIKRRMQDTEKLEDLFDEMLKLRTQVAKNAGFANFRDYQFRRFNRFDYTPDDCFKFHTAVEQFVVPLTQKSLEERRQALKIDTIRPWDTQCDKYGRDPLYPFTTDYELAQGCLNIFYKVDKRLGEQFNIMLDLGLLDLGSRKGKAPGGYQSTLTEIRLPFIFMNAVGLNRDLTTLLHEGGHAFHSLAAADQPIIDYRHSPMEFAEVASMSMEHLGMPYLEEFYSPADAARARCNQMQGDISILPWIAAVDAFQHWIYTNPGHTRSERADYWLSLMDRFAKGIDWSGWEEVSRYGWHGQLHIFEYPFYYIEYGIALLGALQIWRNARQGSRQAIDAYLAALKLGGSKPLPTLFEVAGAKFDLSADTVRPLMDLVQAEMETQGALENRV